MSRNSVSWTNGQIRFKSHGHYGYLPLIKKILMDKWTIDMIFCVLKPIDIKKWTFLTSKDQFFLTLRIYFDKKCKFSSKIFKNTSKISKNWHNRDLGCSCFGGCFHRFCGSHILTTPLILKNYKMSINVHG